MRIKVIGASGAALVGIAVLVLAVGSPADPASPSAESRLGSTPEVPRGAEARPGPKLKECPSDGSVNFDRYTAGPELDGQPVTSTKRVCEPLYTGGVAPPTRVNSDTVVYGSCTPPEGGGSCAFPLTVENWPACERNLALYERYPSPDGMAMPYESTRIRGVPAAIFDEGTRIEVYTGDVTVVVTATDAQIALRAARALRGKHRGAPVDELSPLPAPEAGAIEGEMEC